MAELESVDVHYAPRAGGPNGSQLAFHNDRFKVRTRVLFAGTGGGKTAAACFEDLRWLRDGYTGVAFAPDLPKAKRNLIPAFEDLFRVPESRWESLPIIESWNRSELHLRVVSGGELWMLGLDDPETAESLNLDFAHVNEARLIRRWRQAWPSIKRRLRGSKPGNPTGAWIETHSPTPDLFDEFEGPKRDPASRVYRWSTTENPLLTADYLRDIERSHTGSAYEAVVLGRFSRPAGLVYAEYEAKRHLQPWPSNAGVPVKPERVTYGVDWGWTAPCAIVAVAWRGNVAHAVAEYYGEHRTLDEMRTALKDLQATWGAGKAWCDASRPEHIDQFNKASLPAEAYRGKVADGVSLVKDRFRGGELLVDARCENVLRELDLYAYPPDGGEDPEKGNDHAMDALRYAVVGGMRRRKRLGGF